MKKITHIVAVLASSVSLVAFTTSLNAQSVELYKSKTRPMLQHFNFLTETIDTLMPPSMSDLTCANWGGLYIRVAAGAHDGGYVTGNNNAHDKEVAERYAFTGTAQVTDALAWLYIGTPNSTSNVSCSVYSVNTANNSPSTLLGSSAAKAITALDTAGGMFNNFTFPTPVNVTNGFFLSFVIPTGSTDSVANRSTLMDYCSPTDDAAWVKRTSNAWASLKTTYGGSFFIDLFLWPVINTTVGIENDFFIDGIKLGQNQPNPAVSNTIVQYELQNQAAVTFTIVDVTGKTILTLDQGSQTAGRHLIEIPAGKLAAGTYFYSLKADNHRITKKMIIE